MLYSVGNKISKDSGIIKEHSCYLNWMWRLEVWQDVCDDSAETFNKNMQWHSNNSTGIFVYKDLKKEDVEVYRQTD